MNKISGTNTVQFKSTEEVFGSIHEELSSFSEAGILDEGLFFKWVNDVLGKFGMAYYSEEIAIIPIAQYKAQLPKNFKTFYAAYSCDYLSSNSSDNKRGLFSYYTDIITQELCVNNCCITADPCLTSEKRVTVENYVQGNPIRTLFSNFQLLTLGNDAIREICEFHGLNRQEYGNPNQISVANGHINTNFNNGYLYLFYYGLPVDPKRGLPLIPNAPRIEQAIEAYITYRIFRKMWLNNESPDLERKVAKLEQEKDDAMASAFIETNTPSYQSLKKKININKQSLQNILNTNTYNYGR